MDSTGSTPEPARFLCPWHFPGKNTWVGCHFLHQRIFPTWGSNPGILYWLNHQGSHYNIILKVFQVNGWKSLGQGELINCNPNYVLTSAEFILYTLICCTHLSGYIVFVKKSDKEFLKLWADFFLLNRLHSCHFSHIIYVVATAGVWVLCKEPLVCYCINTQSIIAKLL